MRYENWDILLFPYGDHVPLKEFKTECYVVPDNDRGLALGSFGLPTLNTFVPSLHYNTPFTISILSWGKPPITQATRSYSNHPELVLFDVRVYIDGRVVGMTVLDQNTKWPVTIQQSFAFTKNGELDSLRFPAFREEILYQPTWSPADDLGRIKVTITEAFPRDSATTPLERVKNVVAFSFQHAPLDILETSTIAWPNSSMWYGALLPQSMPLTTYTSKNGSASHSHFPHQSDTPRDNTSSTLDFTPATNLHLAMNPDDTTSCSDQSCVVNNSQLGADATTIVGDLVNWGDVSRSDTSSATAHTAYEIPMHRNLSNVSSDLSMPDYASSYHSGRNWKSSGTVNTPPGLMNPTQKRVAKDDGQASLHKAPNDKPATKANDDNSSVTFAYYAQSLGIPCLPIYQPALEAALPYHHVPSSTSLHNIPSPALEVRSRKTFQAQHHDIEKAPLISSTTDSGKTMEKRKTLEPLFTLIENTDKSHRVLSSTLQSNRQLVIPQNGQRSASLGIDIEKENHDAGTGIC